MYMTNLEDLQVYTCTYVHICLFMYIYIYRYRYRYAYVDVIGCVYMALCTCPSRMLKMS